MIPDLIFDVGLHEAQDTAHYLWKGFRVVAVDANPEFIRQAKARFAEAVASQRLILVNAAIADQEGEGSFWICDSETAWSSFDVQMAARKGSAHHRIAVQTTRLARLLEEYGVPFFLKIDIEGSDALCLESLQTPDLPVYVSFEISDVGAIDRLVSLGYDGFKLIDQYSHCQITFPPTQPYRAWCMRQKVRRSRHFAVRVFRKLGGRFLLNAVEERRRNMQGWRFEHGSSGPFGEDTPGTWQSGETAKATFLQHADLTQSCLGYKVDVWCDVHARKTTPP